MQAHQRAARVPAVFDDRDSVGCYAIVADANLGHPLKWKHLPGPYEAVEEFLAAHMIELPWASHDGGLDDA